MPGDVWSRLREVWIEATKDFPTFVALGGIRLRRYQVETAQLILDSVKNQEGRTICAMLPRQSGKNELQAQLEAYLLTLYADQSLEMVKFSPTWKPQALNAMARLERVLNAQMITAGKWRKRSGYIYFCGDTTMSFFSAQPESNVMGATASLLLQVDEAQSVDVHKYDREINPMAASRNATRVFWGTAWTDTTLLARELKAAREVEKALGKPVTIVRSGEQVGQESEAYRLFVAQEVAKFGRNHPIIRSQYFSEEITGQVGMFTDELISRMYDGHTRETPKPGAMYLFLVDVGGERLLNPDGEDILGANRDSTVLTIVRVEEAKIKDEFINNSQYLVVDRYIWLGEKSTDIYIKIRELSDRWRPHKYIIDSTGIGAGLASFLERAYGQSVVKFVFTGASKSKLGWTFVALLETGRFKDWTPLGEDEAYLFQQQLRNVVMEISEGPERRLKYAVPADRRDQYGDPVHDDLVMSAVLVGVMEEEPMGSGYSQVIEQADILQGLDKIL